MSTIRDLPQEFLEGVCQLFTHSRRINQRKMFGISQDLLNLRSTCSFFYSLVNNAPITFSEIVIMNNKHVTSMYNYMGSSTNWRFRELEISVDTSMLDRLSDLVEKYPSLFRDELLTLTITEPLDIIAGLFCNEKTTIIFDDRVNGMKTFSRCSEFTGTGFENLRELELYCVIKPPRIFPMVSLRSIQIENIEHLDWMLPRVKTSEVPLYPNVTVMKVWNGRDPRSFDVLRHTSTAWKLNFPKLDYLELKSWGNIRWDEPLSNGEVLDFIPESCTTLKIDWALLRVHKTPKNVKELCLLFDRLEEDEHIVLLGLLNSLQLKIFNIYIHCAEFRARTPHPHFSDDEIALHNQRVEAFTANLTQFLRSLMTNNKQLDVLSLQFRGPRDKSAGADPEYQTLTTAASNQLRVLIVDFSPIVLRSSIDHSLMTRIDYLVWQMDWFINRREVGGGYYRRIRFDSVREPRRDDGVE